MILPQAFGDRRKLTRQIHRHYLAPLATRQAREGTWALACALRGSDAHYAKLWDARARLGRLPITIVWGERDPVLTSAHRDKWIAAFPGANVVRVPAAGHFVAEEAPEAVVAAVRAAA